MKLTSSILAAALFVVGVSAARAETVQIKFAGFAPPNSGSELITKWWMDQIESRSQGAVKFRRFAPGQLCKPAEIVDCIRDGRADAGSSVFGYTPALFPLTSIDGLPFITSDQSAQVKAFAEMLQKNKDFLAEHEKLGLKPQVFWSADPLLVGTTFEANNLSDFKGKRIRAIGVGPAAFVKALGAEPAAMTAAEQYEAMQTKVIEGFTNSYEGAVGFKFAEVAPYWYDPGVGSFVSVGMWLSDATWKRLSPEVQKVVADVNRDLVNGKAIELYNEPLESACEKLKSGGRLKAFKMWPKEWVDDIKAKVGNGPYETWAANVRNAGLPDPKPFYDAYVAAVRSAETNKPSIAQACMRAFSK